MTIEATDITGFRVANARMHHVAADICDRLGRRTVAYALHVGGLNERRNQAFRAAMDAADIIYADGAAVVLLGRLAGAERMGRAPTTDLGGDVIAEAGRRLERAPRVGLIGGTPERVHGAAAALRERYGAHTPFIVDGYRDGYEDELADAKRADLDLLFVGLGMPKEAIWVHQHLDALPEIPILTSGGWFGFLAGEERRAPGWMQRTGLEWVYRVAQSPSRLACRYGRGLWSTGIVAVQTVLTRWFGGRR